MVDVELLLREYGQALDELCPEVTEADIVRRLMTNQEDFVTTTSATQETDEPIAEVDLLSTAQRRPPRHWKYVFAAAAAVVVVILAAALFQDGDENSRTITDEIPTTTELPTPTTTPPRVREHEAPMKAPNNSDVDGSLATLSATEDEAEFTIATTGLEPGHPVTAWLFAMDVDACSEAFPSANECQTFMLLEQPELGNIGFLGGGIVAEDGTLTIEGSIGSAGLPRQWYETPLVSFLNTRFEVRLKDHGEPIEGLVEEMTTTYRAGCDATSVLGSPEIAHADGTPGPNTCTERQSVAFDPSPE